MGGGAQDRLDHEIDPVSARVAALMGPVVRAALWST